MNAGLIAVGIRRLNELLEDDIDTRKKKENVSDVNGSSRTRSATTPGNVQSNMIGRLVCLWVLLLGCQRWPNARFAQEYRARNKSFRNTCRHRENSLAGPIAEVLASRMLIRFTTITAVTLAELRTAKCTSNDLSRERTLSLHDKTSTSTRTRRRASFNSAMKNVAFHSRDKCMHWNSMVDDALVGTGRK